MRFSSCSVCLLVASSVCLLLTGCAVSTTGALSPDAGATITGRVVGAQAPLVGAQVYLFAANTTGYGGPGIAASSSNASVSLLTNVPGSTMLDMSGGATNGDYYVATSGVTVSCPGGGCFTITGDYSCTAGTPVYLYSLGGSQGGVASPAAGLLAAGNCPSGGSLPSSLYIVVNEVSTVAAAYSFAGFASDALHVSSSGTTLAQTGIANAFANPLNLVGTSTGAALATTPAGNGTVPQTTINTLANILAACVNSSGAGSSACSTLFSNAESAGSTGTSPTDTATAAINMAHNPVANIAALYALSTATPPFAPALSAQPNDFTIGLNFAGGGLLGCQNIAIDGTGNAWVANRASPLNDGVYTITELSSSGSFQSGANGYGGGGLNEPFGIAIDESGNAWVTNLGGNSVTEFSDTGTPTSGSPYTGGGLDEPEGIAIGAAGNAFVNNYGGGTITKISTSGAILSGTHGYGGGGIADPGGGIALDSVGDVWVASLGDGSAVTKLSSSSGSILSGPFGYTGNGIGDPAGLAIDSSGDVWVVNSSPTDVVELSNSSGSFLSGTSGFSGGGMDLPYMIAIDGAGSAWVANYGGSLTQLSGSGAFLSGANGYTSGSLDFSTGVAIDGSGDVWVSNSGNSVSEIIGAATPVVTPLAVGVKNNTLGTRP